VAKLFVDEPISSDDDEAFVTSLDPGEGDDPALRSKR